MVVPNDRRLISFSLESLQFLVLNMLLGYPLWETCMNKNKEDCKIMKSNLSKKIVLLTSLLLAPTLSHGSGDLPVVAVAKFKSTVDQNAPWYEPSSKPANFEVMVETQLMKIGRFKIFERNRVDEVLTEQALQENFSNNGTTLKLAGVDYLIYGSITNYSSESKKIATGNFVSAKLETKFGVDVKIVDSLSGEIRRAETVNVIQESASSISTGQFSQGEIASDGLIQAQRKAAKLVASLLVESIFPISVVDVDGNDIYLNYGDSILSAGDTLKILKPGRQLVDPQTGMALGTTETEVAQVRVRDATAQFSIATLVSGTLPSSGDTARLVLSAQSSKATKPQRKKLGRKI